MFSKDGCRWHLQDTSHVLRLLSETVAEAACRCSPVVCLSHICGSHCTCSGLSQQSAQQLMAPICMALHAHESLVRSQLEHLVWHPQMCLCVVQGST